MAQIGSGGLVSFNLLLGSRPRFPSVRLRIRCVSTAVKRELMGLAVGKCRVLLRASCQTNESLPAMRIYRRSTFPGRMTYDRQAQVFFDRRLFRGYIVNE